MGKSVVHDLLRDRNFRYFSGIFKRIQLIGLYNVIKELKTYFMKYSSFPLRISNQKGDLLYKLFVFYNYFKIIYVHPEISNSDLMDYFPTRLQKYFIYKLDPKDQRVLTNNKILFYQKLVQAKLPFPNVILYTKNNTRYTLAENPYVSEISLLPEKVFIKPISENGGVNAGVISSSNINKVPDDFLVQELAVNHPDLILLAGSIAFNTIRIITYIDNNNKINILSAIIRLSKDKQVDNWGKGSINVKVDITTGKLGKIGITKRNEQYTMHPAGNVIFEDFMIPYWSEFLKVVEKACETFTFLRLIAWDIGISKEGPLIVEANAGCDFFHAQLFVPYGESVLIKDLINGR